MHLPTELHDLILTHVEHSDLPQYRLVNRKFAHAATSRLFCRVGVMAESSSVITLARIASRDDLRRHVESLTWQSWGKDIIPIENDRDKRWDEGKWGIRGLVDVKYEDILTIIAPGRGGTNSEVDIAGKENCTGIHVLSTLLSNFPNLYRIQIQVHDGPSPNEYRLPISLPLIAEHEMLTLLTTAYNAPGCSIADFSINASPTRRPLFRTTNHWSSLMNTNVCSNLTSLSLSLAFTLGAEERESIRTESDDSHIPGTWSTAYSEVDVEEQVCSFKAFLSSMVQLQSLTHFEGMAWHQIMQLVPDGGVRGRLSIPLLEDIFFPLAFEKAVYPHLRELVLKQPSARTAELKGLLNAHKETLRVVRLEMVKFYVCGRRDVQDRLPDEGCIPLGRFLKHEMEGLETWELSCHNCECVHECCCECGNYYCCNNDRDTVGSIPHAQLVLSSVNHWM